MSFSFEAFKNVQLCLVSLLKPNWGVRWCWQPVGSWGPQALTSPRSHSGVSVQLLANSSLLKNPGIWEMLVQPFLLQMTELRAPEGRLSQSPLMRSSGSVRMAAPSKQRTYFLAGSDIFQWWHLKTAPVVFCLFWRKAAWLPLLL